MQAIDTLRQYLASQGAAGILLTRRDNYAWLTGGAENHVIENTETGVGTLAVTPDDIRLFADCSDAARLGAEQNPLGADVTTVPWHQPVQKAMAEYIAGRQFVSDTGLLGTANVQPDLIALRLPLSDSAITQYRRLGRQAAAVVEEVCRGAVPGVTEGAIAARVACGCLQQGIQPACVLVGADARIEEYRHLMPTGKQAHRLLMVTLGGQRHGLWVSLTRMVALAPLPEETRRRYAAVQQVFAAMQLAMQPGLGYGSYFAKTQEAYRLAGFASQWQQHHQGGPTGYACREFVIGPDTPGVLAVNQAYAWNPTITGVKCEDTTLLLPGGAETLTQTGQWPTQMVAHDKGEYKTADILLKGGV